LHFKHILFLSFLLLLIFSPTILVGEVQVRIIKTISFGTVDLHPGGDTILIDARTGSSFPGSSRSIVSEGGSGLIRISSDENVHMDILYPASTIMRSNNHSLSVSEIDNRSQYAFGGVDINSDIPLDVNIGGQMSLIGQEVDGNYSGSIPITINFE